MRTASWRLRHGRRPQAKPRSPDRRSPQCVAAFVEKLYLSTLSRRPLPGEMDVALGVLDKDIGQGAENLQWALLNKPEFLFNY